MDAITNIDSVDNPVPKRRSIGYWIAIFASIMLFAIVVSAAIIWWQREPIAAQFVDKELKKLGLPATYEIQEIGPQTQIIRNIRVGPKDRPDLTIASAIVEMRWGWNGPYPVRIVVDDMTLRGRFSGGKLSFGSLDKLRDPKNTEPFTLPDIDVVARTIRVSLATEHGPIGFAMAGKGNLAAQFAGKLAASAPKLSAAGCTVETAKLSGQFALANGAPSFTGPFSVTALNCGPGSAKSGPVRAVLTADMTPDFTNWTADTDMTAANVAFGTNTSAIVLGALSGTGNLASADLDYDLRANSARIPQLSVGAVTAKGDAALNWKGAKLVWTGTGDVTAKRAALDPRLLASIRAQAKRNGSLPFDPVVTKAATALGKAGAAFDAAFPLSYEGQGNSGRIVVRTLAATSTSGAQFGFSGGQGVALSLPGGQYALSGTVTTSGGELPSVVASVQRNPRTGMYSGRAVFAPYAAAGASVSLDPLSFETTAAGLKFATALGFSGPLPGGKVDRAYIPLVGTYAARAGLVLAGGCTTLRFDALVLSGVQAGQSSLPLCAAPGQPLVRFDANGLAGKASIPNLRWAGKLGASSLLLTAKSANLDFATLAFSGDGVAVRLGDSAAPIAFDIAQITGTSAGKGIFTGRIVGAAGRIGAVPLLLSNIGANWSYANGQFGALGAMQFEDAEQVDRFKPMLSKDFVLDYVGDIITASGGVYEPKTGRAVAGVNIRHSLSGNNGRADLNVIDLKFDDTLQPEMLSPITLGVIANARGIINGTGQIRWNNGRVTSDGTFRSAGLDLAAAFGPVSGLSGEIMFSDLLGLQTAPGQIAKIASVNPGQEVVNGIVRYQLLPDQQVAVEGGTWEFAGGQLLLLPTVLDFSAEKPRRFLFAVRGVDAELFLYRFGYANLSATGVFDGELPMVFDQAGGRIENGVLKVREGGGTLAYIGELSNRDLGFMANFAFDALKSLKFDNLNIAMNGDLGGELVTDVKFTGISQGQGARRNFITRQIAKLPFEFNISIKAPFRQLLDSGRRLSDPTVAVQQNIDALLADEEQQNGTPPAPLPPPAPAIPTAPVSAPVPTPNTPPPKPEDEPDVQPLDSQPKVKGDHER